MRRVRVFLVLAVATLGVALWRPWSSEASPQAEPVAPDSIVASAPPSADLIAAAPLGEPEALATGPDGAGVDAAATGSYPVHVQVKRMDGTRAGPASGVPIDVGVALRTSRPGDAQWTVVTDAEGAARLDVPAAAVATLGDTGRPRVWARLAGDGVLTRVSSNYLPDATDSNPEGKPDIRTVTLQLQQIPGVVIQGRVTWPDGAPVTAQVELWNEDGRPLPGRQRTVTDDAGHFELEAAAEGLSGLHAVARSTPHEDVWSDFSPRHCDLGTGVSSLFEVDFSTPAPFIEVVVASPGVLRGSVLDDQGRPAAGLALLAVVAELDDEYGSFRLPYPRHRQLQRQGRGHVWVTTSTEADGSFEIRGLRADLYNLRARLDPDDSDGYPVLLTPRPVASPGPELHLTLTRPHLAIHLRGPDGQPTGLDEFELALPKPWEGMEAWPEEPVLVATWAEDSSHRGGWLGPYLRIQGMAPGEYIAELPGGGTVDVSLYGGELPWTGTRVTVPADAGRTDVHLTRPDPMVPGFLLLEVVAPDGVPIHDNVRVRVLHPASGVALLDHRHEFSDADDWPARMRLPPGDARLIVEDHPWVNDSHGTLMHPREHGGFETTVNIVSGRETPVHARLSKAARLTVRLRGEPTAADREAVQPSPSAIGDDHEEYIAYWSRFVRLHLEGQGRWAEPVHFAGFWGEGTSAAGTHLFGGLVLGSEGTSQALTPGESVLVARTPGGRQARVPVHLIEGQTLAVTVTLD